MEGKRNKKLETISNEMIEYCIKNGLTVSEMNRLTIVFPQIVRDKVCAFESVTAFTLNSVQGDLK